MNRGGEGRPRILTFLPQFLPGEKGGGPVQSAAGLLEALKDEFDFRVVTSDHDLGERDPFPGVQPDVWLERYGGRILYLSGAKLPARHIVEILRKGEFDLIYLNSVFSRRFSMLPLSVWLIGGARHVPLILAPRGEFSPGALALKPRRKAAYLALAHALRLYRNVRWHASSPMEEQDILKVALGRKALKTDLDTATAREWRPAVMVASDLATKQPAPTFGSWPAKNKGALSVVFLSRIAPMKNLDGALRMLRGLRGEVTFTIYGPPEDDEYWRRCQEEMGALNGAVAVRYAGVLPHADVTAVFRAADLFLFPTRGENFGHVIAEALTAGCPVLTSDQTPWRDLEAMKAGWDFPLADAGRFTKTLQDCIDMEPGDFETLRLGARDRGLRYLRDATGVEQHRRLFSAALADNMKPWSARKHS